MKKFIALLLAVIVCLLLLACGANDSKSTINQDLETEPQANDNGSEITFADPIVLIDNDTVKVIIKSKFKEHSEIYGVEIMGYNVSIENKTDQYISLVPKTTSIDGFMLDLQEGPVFLVDAIAPGKKANSQLVFFIERMTSVELETLDDLINFDGLCVYSKLEIQKKSPKSA